MSEQDNEVRRWANVVYVALLAAAVAALPLIPPVHRLLGVGVVDVGISMGLFVVVMVITTLLHGTRWYRAIDKLETVVTQASVLSLVFASGRPDSFFWVPAMVHASLLGSNPRDLMFHRSVVVAMPLLTGLAFLISGDAGGLAIAIVVALLALYVYNFNSNIARRLDALVVRDRERIARELHDGVGTDLAALAWRLRELDGTEDLVERLGQGSADLRAIVWALRAPSRSLSELAAYVRTRATELAGARAITVTADGTGELTGERALDLLRGVLELVHNAARHGRGAIRVALYPDRAVVEDDGPGLPAGALERTEGGLANLRKRGTLRSLPGAGTRLELAI